MMIKNETSVESKDDLVKKGDDQEREVKMDFKSRPEVSGRKSTQEIKISENALVRMLDCVYS